MARKLQIRVQKLFFLTVVAKVGTAFLGWRFQMPWSLGFAVPLTVMGLYIVLGLHRADDDVPDEKFADTCYYLGFIFTITSIIFSLFDLPNIGTRLEDIAVRFGAAMVSTVLGLAVRVYLVSFKKDAADAVEEAEDAVIAASQRFREQLVMAFEKLRDFEEAVDKAAMSSVERVNLQVEKLSQDHSSRLASFFSELAQQNQRAFTSVLEEVKGASLKLSTSVDRYSLGIQRNLASIEDKVTRFAGAVTERLQSTTFPDDYFSTNLAEPMQLLQNASREVATQVLHASQEVSESSVVLSGALKKLKAKTTSAEASLDAVGRLATTQQAVLDSAQTQLDGLRELHGTLTKFEALLSALIDGVASNAAAASKLTEKVEAVVDDGNHTREQIVRALSVLNQAVTSSNTAAETLGEKLERNASTSDAIANQLGLAAVSTSRVAARLDDISARETQSTSHLVQALGTADGASRELASAVVELRTLVRELAGAALKLPSPVTNLGAAPAPGQLAGALERADGVQVSPRPLLYARPDVVIPVLVPGTPSFNGARHDAGGVLEPFGHAAAAVAPSTMATTKAPPTWADTRPGDGVFDEGRSGS